VAVATFSDPDTAPVPKFLMRILVRKIFKFENPTPATINATDTQQIFYCASALAVAFFRFLEPLS